MELAIHVTSIVNNSGFIPLSTPRVYEQYNQEEEVDRHAVKNTAFSEPTARLISSVASLDSTSRIFYTQDSIAVFSIQKVLDQCVGKSIYFSLTIGRPFM